MEGTNAEGNTHAILSSDVPPSSNTSALAAAVSEAQRQQKTPMLPVVERVEDDDDDYNTNFDVFAPRDELESKSNRELRLQAPHYNSATADFDDTESDILSIATTPTRQKGPADESLFSDSTVRRRSRLLLTFGRRSSATTAIGGNVGGGSVTGEGRAITAHMMSTGRSGGSSNFDAASDSHGEMTRSPTSLLCFPRRTRDAVHGQQGQRPTNLGRAQQLTGSNPSSRSEHQSKSRLLHAASTQSTEGGSVNTEEGARGHQKPPRQFGGGIHTSNASNIVTGSVSSVPSSQGRSRVGVYADARQDGVKGSGGSGRKLVRDVSLQRDEFIEFTTGVSTAGSHNGVLTRAGGSGHSLTGSVFGLGQGTRRNAGEKGAPRWLTRLLSSGGIELGSRRLDVDYLDDDDDMYDDEDNDEDNDEDEGGGGADEEVHEAKSEAGEKGSGMARLQHRRTVGGERMVGGGNTSNGNEGGEGRKGAKKMWRLWSKRS